MSPKISSRSAGGIVINDRGQMLIVQNFGSTWSIPKGKLEGKETPLQTAVREIWEETGLRKLSLVGKAGTYLRTRMGAGGVQLKDHIMQMHVFLFITRESATTPRDKDITAMEWKKPSEAAKKLTHPTDRTFIRKTAPLIERAARLTRETKPISRVPPKSRKRVLPKQQKRKPLRRHS